jgi:hypothetical protein
MVSETLQGLTLPNLRAGFRYLCTQGWKLSEKTIYLHRDEGKLKPGRDGTYSTSALDRYARRYLRRLDGSGGVEEESESPSAKDEAEIRLRTARANYMELRQKILADQYVPADEFERALAARASVFKSDLQNFAHGKAQDILTLVNGDQALVPDLIQCLWCEFENIMARYSDPEASFPGPGAPCELPEPEDQTKEDKTNHGI